MEIVFLCFDTDLRENSLAGKRIQDYLETDNFENTLLYNWETGREELVILDTDKFNLLIFSAYWCGPCHAAIPHYKEIYDKVGDKLDLVYVSIDKEDDFDKWSEVMTDNEIPWRSVIVGDREWFTDKYHIGMIPSAFLVFPNGRFERIDPRNEEELEYLYGVIGVEY